MELGPYLVRIALLLPVLCGVLVGGLWAAKRFLGVGVVGAGSTEATDPARRPARVAQTLLLGPGARLAVVEFADRRLLLTLGKGGVTKLADVSMVTLPEATLTPSRALPSAFGATMDGVARSTPTPFTVIRVAASRLARAAYAR